MTSTFLYNCSADWRVQVLLVSRARVARDLLPNAELGISSTFGNTGKGYSYKTIRNLVVLYCAADLYQTHFKFNDLLPV